MVKLNKQKNPPKQKSKMKGRSGLFSCNCITMTDVFENKLSACPAPLTLIVAMVLSNEPSRIWTPNQI